MRSALAFFRIVPPVPPLMLWTFVIITALSAVVVLVDPTRVTGVLTAIGLLQLFATASGFAGPARRGYYDLLFTRGDRRLYIGLAQWMMAAAAGAASWIALAGLEAAVTGRARQAFAPGTLTSMFLVSTIPWATTVALPRFAGAVGWLLVMVLVSTLWPHVLTASSTASWVTEAAAVLLLPGSLVGAPFARGPFIAVPALLGAVLSMAVALWWIERTDIPLEAAQ